MDSKKLDAQASMLRSLIAGDPRKDPDGSMRAAHDFVQMLMMRIHELEARIAALEKR